MLHTRIFLVLEGESSVSPGNSLPIEYTLLKHFFVRPSQISTDMKLKYNSMQCHQRCYLSRMISVHFPSLSQIGYDTLDEFPNLRFRTKYHLLVSHSNLNSPESIYSTRLMDLDGPSIGPHSFSWGRMRGESLI